MHNKCVSRERCTRKYIPEWEVRVASTLAEEEEAKQLPMDGYCKNPKNDERERGRGRPGEAINHGLKRIFLYIFYFLMSLVSVRYNC